MVDGSLESPSRVLVKCVIELLFLSLAVEALLGKMCQNSLPSGGVGQLEPRFQGKRSESKRGKEENGERRTGKERKEKEGVHTVGR